MWEFYSNSTESLPDTRGMVVGFAHSMDAHAARLETDPELFDPVLGILDYRAGIPVMSRNIQAEIIAVTNLGVQFCVSMDQSDMTYVVPLDFIGTTPTDQIEQGVLTAYRAIHRMCRSRAVQMTAAMDRISRAIHMPSPYPDALHNEYSSPEDLYAVALDDVRRIPVRQDADWQEIEKLVNANHIMTNPEFCFQAFVRPITDAIQTSILPVARSLEKRMTDHAQSLTTDIRRQFAEMKWCVTAQDCIGDQLRYTDAVLRTGMAIFLSQTEFIGG